MYKKIIKSLTNFEKKITKNFNTAQMKLWNILIFLLTFSVFSSILHFLVWVNWNPLFLQKVTAQIVSHILNFLGMPSASFGEYIRVNNFGLIKIVKDCLGWKSFVALCALIVSTRKVRWKNKVYSILAGSLIIFTGNIIRLTSTIYFGSKSVADFKIIHSIIWQWGLTFFVIFIWAIWLKYFSGSKF